MATKVEGEAAERFTDRYRRAGVGPLQEVELEVLGVAYGSTGYTTLAQADDLGWRLGLGPGDLLADIGAGSGWPGLHLAATSGCRLVSADLVREGVRRACARASEDGLADRTGFVVSTGTRPALRPGAFDAVVHTDVLCCLAPKLSVLRACRRLLRPGGRMAFTVIHLADGLGPSERRRARRAGPGQVAAREGYAAMTARAGFDDVVEVDVTPEYLVTKRAWWEATQKRADEVRGALPDGELDALQADRRFTLTAIEDGLLRRSLLTAVAP